MPAETTPAAPAEPLAEMIAPARTALVVIDVQRDFAAPDGAMGQFGCDLGEVEGVIDQIEAMIAAARKAGAPVVFARVWTTPETDAGNLKAFYRRKGYPDDALDVCRAGTPGVDYYRVQPQPGEIEVRKLLFSGFVGTDLDAQLGGRKIDTLVLAGLTTDCCVDSTTRDAFHRGYNCFVVRDACSAYAAELHNSTLESLEKNYALILDAAEVLGAWR